ncbi:MAG: hypothetical protein LBK82_15415 [Planctomycetaceae bacterium]|jgi:hypothetical protein|nr:hypothetical protein [Planctomycetaceae bacterium]
MSNWKESVLFADRQYEIITQNIQDAQGIPCKLKDDILKLISKAKSVYLEELNIYSNPSNFNSLDYNSSSTLFDSLRTLSDKTNIYENKLRNKLQVLGTKENKEIPKPAKKRKPLNR